MKSSSKSLPETRWTLIARASASDQEALAELLKLYLPALRTHLVFRRGIAPGDADDLLQAFVMKKMLERPLLAQAREDRGRFRNYVLRALENFVRDCDRGQRREVQAISLEEGFEPPARKEECPDLAETAFAAEVVHEALRRARTHCEECGHLDAWEIFDARVLRPILRDEPAEGYAALVSRLALSSPQKASNLLLTAILGVTTFRTFLHGASSS